MFRAGEASAEKSPPEQTSSRLLSCFAPGRCKSGEEAASTNFLSTVVLLPAGEVLPTVPFFLAGE